LQGLKIAHVGSFYAGGRPIEITGQEPRQVAFTRSAVFEHNPNGQYYVEQAYVQYFIPEQLVSDCPIVLLHGGGFTGAMWEATPDGRPGWLQDLLRSGFAVYVVDNVERGRAGWAALPGVWHDQPIMRSAEEAWSLFRFGRREDFAARTPFAGQRFPTGNLDKLIVGQVPRWLTTGEAAVAAFEAVLQRVGRCCVVAHSQGGEVAFRAAARQPHLVSCLVALEPSGFSDIPAAFEALAVLFVSGDYMDKDPLWISLSAQTEVFAQKLANVGARVDRWVLPDMGVNGNSHMIMMDDNSAEVATMVSQWIGQRAEQGG
jgi:pimeloyl-ACP methyl ester carboxylesterase